MNSGRKCGFVRKKYECPVVISFIDRMTLRFCIDTLCMYKDPFIETYIYVSLRIPKTNRPSLIQTKIIYVQNVCMFVLKF